MTEQTPQDSGPDRPARRPNPFDPLQTRVGWLQRRQDRVLAEVQRNRRGEYKVPTWVLTAILLAILALWVGVIIFG